ncbi:uncharacterized protein LOC143549226 [Bidens hawaiensis]|uniref:uncharacterized protein LOC143549226 n=1 Tax=Bidens hawaiensis TaxID=980011 RepID=UPI00404B20BC
MPTEHEDERQRLAAYIYPLALFHGITNMNIKRYFQTKPSNLGSSSSSSKPSKVDLDDLPWDPSERQPNSSYHSKEVLKKIFEELGDDVFSILVDESRDISKKEQMAVVLRYVDKLGFVKERFIGLVHVMETTALSLKSAIDKLFARHNLSIGRVRGQGYNGESNMSENSGEISAHKSEAHGLQLYMKTFSFVFYLHLMKYILGVTNTLCEALQKKDQDMLNAIKLVKLTSEGLKSYRLEGFDSLLEDVTSFCAKYDIEVVDMKAEYFDPKNQRRKTGITNRDHYVVNNFNTVLDMQIQELGNRFNEVTTNLLMCMSSLSLSYNFSAFDKLNLLKLAEMYPYDFGFDEKDKLIYELGHYIANMKEYKRFANLNGVGDLAKMMVKTRLHIDYPLVYRLIKLSLVLPVATASVERCFSSMRIVKTDLRNRMGDGYMNDSCICYIEREFLQQVSVEDVMQRFQKMKTRREQL